MSIADTATGTTAHDRTFWRADYARFARAIRRTRHAMGDGHTAKSAEHQARCDELAAWPFRLATGGTTSAPRAWPWTTGRGAERER